MAKISIDLKTISGDLPPEEVLSPTEKQVGEAMEWALFALRLMGKVADLVEVIKIDFSQRCLEETHTRERSVLSARFIAIMSHPSDRDHKVEVCVAIDPIRQKISPNMLALKLVTHINMAISAHISSQKYSTKIWEDALKSSTRACDDFVESKH